MSDNRYRMSREKHEELKAELEHKENVERPALARRLKAAIAMGDLKENAEYISAKEDQGFLEGRIKELEDLISGAIIMEDIKTVTVVEEGFDEEEVYQIVGSSEADPAERKISVDSPIGKALNRAKKGDKVTVDVPGGSITFNVLDVS
ncbi:MAG: transcription elongation factor GreA [Chloroflexi bacterium]|nr:transcription elongation factor GreA [Chloroflexota bacterium]